MNDTTPPKAKMTRAGFFRLMRDWHGYLSAIAFLSLIFFSLTGLMMNHPSLFTATMPPAEEQKLTLTAQEIATVKAAPEPTQELAKLVGGKVSLVGAWRDGDVAEPEIFVRMQGVKGTSDIRGNLVTGEVTVVVEPEHPIGMMNQLHRAEHGGEGWRLVVDLLAIIMIVMSVLGFVIFLSLRFRLRTALALMGGSTILLAGLIFFLIP